MCVFNCVRACVCECVCKCAYVCLWVCVLMHGFVWARMCVSVRVRVVCTVGYKVSFSLPGIPLLLFSDTLA